MVNNNAFFASYGSYYSDAVHCVAVVGEVIVRIIITNQLSVRPHLRVAEFGSYSNSMTRP